MVAALASMLADAAPAIVTSLGVGAAKQFGTQAGKAAGDALFNRQPQQQPQQPQGLFGSIGSGIGGAADAIVGLPGKVVGGILGGVGNIFSGAGNLLSGNRQQVPSSDAQQRFIAMQQQGYR